MLFSQLSTARYGVSMYERTMQGSLGLILALSQQPVVVAVEANSYSFLNYKGVGDILLAILWFQNLLNKFLSCVGYLQ